MLSKHAKISLVALSASLLMTALPAFAQVDLGLGYAQALGLGSVDIRTIVANLIRSLLGFVGIYVVLQIMWGGFLMMTHGGKEDARAKASATITNGIIGLVIIMTASSSAKFIIDAIANATGQYL